MEALEELREAEKISAGIIDHILEELNEVEEDVVDRVNDALENFLKRLKEELDC